VEVISQIKILQLFLNHMTMQLFAKHVLSDSINKKVLMDVQNVVAKFIMQFLTKISLL
jgi:hypothetical protein